MVVGLQVCACKRVRVCQGPGRWLGTGICLPGVNSELWVSCPQGAPGTRVRVKVAVASLRRQRDGVLRLLSPQPLRTRRLRDKCHYSVPFFFHD